MIYKLKAKVYTGVLKRGIMMSMGTILVIDDEIAMRALIKSFLVPEGYLVKDASNGMEALEMIYEESPDLIIVDIMMPFMDGYTFTKELRKSSDTPIIFLSAKGEEWDKVKGLKLGADDYLVKPFHYGELIARIETVLRRSSKHYRKILTIKAGPITIDVENHLAFLDGKEVSLTLKEFGLLSLLVTHRNNLITRNNLMATIWGTEYSGTDRTVDTHIKTLRLKMKQHGVLIKTVWGLGYKLEV